MRRGDPPDPPSLGDVLEWSDTSEVRPRQQRPRPRGPQARLEAMACYGTALAGTGLAVWILLRI